MIITDYIQFRPALISDCDDIMKFISSNVNKNHILAINKSFFLYEYADGDSLNVLLAVEKNSGSLVGIYCFYLYSQTDTGGDFAGGISQVSSECKIPLLGTTLYEKLKEFFSVRSIVSVGMNRNTSYEINRRRNDTYLGSLKHFYILSGNGQYRIASIKEENVPFVTEPDQQELFHYKNVEEMYISFDEDHFRERLPYKSRKYIEHRYFNHPIYRYSMYGMGENLVLVCREVEANGGKALRIVDVLGDASLIRHSGKALMGLMKDNGYEYIDFMEFGMDEADILAAGFTKLELTGANIIPNYFEPFVQKNIEVLCCASLQPALIFKADADQDRPSIIR